VEGYSVRYSDGEVHIEIHEKGFRVVSERSDVKE
jgi:hypothetical protein